MIKAFQKVKLHRMIVNGQKKYMNFQLKVNFLGAERIFSWAKLLDSFWAECLNNCLFFFYFLWRRKSDKSSEHAKRTLFFYCGQFLIVRFLLSVCFFKTAQTNQSTVQTYICNSGMKLSSSILNAIYIVMGNHGGVCMCVFVNNLVCKVNCVK